MVAHNLNCQDMIVRFNKMNAIRMGLWRQAWRERDKLLKESGLEKDALIRGRIVLKLDIVSEEE